MKKLSFRRLILVAVCLPSLLLAAGQDTKNVPPPAGKGQAAPEPPPPAKTVVQADAAPTPDALNFRLIELFNVEQLPGAGTVTLQIGDRQEKIPFGKAGGYYALGMVFDGKGLPEQYGKDFKKNQLIQVALGSVPSRVQGQVPQFGALTVIASKLQTAKKKFPLIVPSGVEKPSDEMGFLLMTSPTTPNARSDEDKLKNTYFAQGGSLTIAAKGTPKLLELKSQGKRLQFKLQMMTCEFDAQLVTPFNASPGKLTGTMEFPLYTPHGKEAIALTQRIASESLETATSMALQEALDADEDAPRRPAKAGKPNQKK